MYSKFKIKFYISNIFYNFKLLINSIFQNGLPLLTDYNYFISYYILVNGSVVESNIKYNRVSIVDLWLPHIDVTYTHSTLSKKLFF